MNTATLQVYNDNTQAYEDYTKYIDLPVKFADLLDEQLDEAEISLKNCPREYFNPLTIIKVEITCTNNAPISARQFQKILDRAQTKVENGNADGKYYEKLIRYFIVANDNSNEILGLKIKRGVNAGKGVYSHQLYLIEITKIAEGFIGDALTFTNALGNDYTE